MNTFHLTISTPDGMLFDDEVTSLRARMIDGDVGILPNHAKYVSAVGEGEALIRLPDGQTRRAACIGGMLSVMDNKARLIATTFEWAEEIDLDRAKRAKERAEQRLAEMQADRREQKVAEAKLRRALVRIQVKQ